MFYYLPIWEAEREATGNDHAGARLWLDSSSIGRTSYRCGPGEADWVNFSYTDNRTFVQAILVLLKNRKKDNEGKYYALYKIYEISFLYTV